MLKIFGFTIYVSAVSTVIAALVGVTAAFFTAHRNFPGRRLLLSFSVVPLCVPPLVVALGYVGFLGVNGAVSRAVVNVFHGRPLYLLYTPLGIMLAQGFYNFPVVTGIVHDAWAQLPDEQQKAARILGAGEKRIFFTITLRQLSGAIAAGCIPVFLFCFFSFMLVLLFSPPGTSTIEVEIYRAFQNTLDFGRGAVLAVLETLTALAVVFLYSVVIRRGQASAPGIEFRRRERVPVRQKERPLFFAVMLLIILFFVCPFVSVFAAAFGDGSFFRLFGSRSFLISVRNTICVGAGTAFLCTAVAFLYAVPVKALGKSGNPLLQTIPLLPMAISSVVISWLAVLVFHRGNALLLVLLETLLYWPVAYRQLQNGLNRLPPQTVSAATLLSRGRLDALRRFYIPECRRVLVSAFGYSFAMSAGDATMPLVLSIPGFNTMALYTYRLASAYRFNQACACGTLLFVVCGIMFVAVKREELCTFR